MRTSELDKRLKGARLLRVDTEEKVQVREIRVLGVLHNHSTPGLHGTAVLVYEMNEDVYVLPMYHDTLADLADGKTVGTMREHGMYLMPRYSTADGDIVKAKEPTGERAKRAVYISGKIAGCAPELVEGKFRFGAAKVFDILTERGEEAEIVKPNAISDMERFDWADYIIRDLMYLRRCDAIYMLKDWKDSPGARVEHEFAKGLGLEIIYEEEL